MKLMEYIEESYENARPGTIDFCLSEYLLMHVFEIGELSLSDISKATGIGKSTVATYFNSETIPGGYVAFKKALSTELGRNVLTIKNHMKWARALIQDLKKYTTVSDSDANDLCQRLLSARKVVFIGPKIYRDSLVTLISFTGRLFSYCKNTFHEILEKYPNTIVMTGNQFNDSDINPNFFRLPFQGDDEGNNTVFIEIMRYLKWHYYENYVKDKETLQ